MKEEITFDEIKEIMDLIRRTEDVTAFSLKCGDVEIALSRGGQPLPVSGGQPSGPQAAPAAAPSEPASESQAEKVAVAGASAETSKSQGGAHVEPETEEAGEGEVVIKAPMVGTFYRSPKPGAPPFVEVGKEVEEHTVLCIIEVMKLMSSIEAKMKGTVTKILVEDAQPVEHGQPLMIIRPAGS